MTTEQLIVTFKFGFCLHYRLSSLKQLKVLDVSDNNLTHGLPMVITKITSLETLELRKCYLSQLPERYSIYSDTFYKLSK